MMSAEIFNRRSMARAASLYSSLLPDNIIGEVRDQETQKEIAKINAEAQKDFSKTTQGAQRDFYKNDAKQDLDLLNSRKFAGNLAALGGLTYAGGKLLFKDDLEPPKPVERESADFSSVLETQQGLLEQSQETAKKLAELSRKGGLTVEDVELNLTDSSDSSSTGSSKTSKGSTPSSPVELKIGGAGWSPLGATIQFAEGTYRQGDKKYNTGNGYEIFEGNTYPDRVFSGGSAAAGAYQIMPDTWKNIQSNLNLPDFGPESQEKAGEWLAQQRGVQTSKPFTKVSELEYAVNQLSPEWAAFPTKSTGRSFYDGVGGNKSIPFPEIRKFYEKKVGYQLQ